MNHGVSRFRSQAFKGLRVLIPGRLRLITWRFQSGDILHSADLYLCIDGAIETIQIRVATPWAKRLGWIFPPSSSCRTENRLRDFHDASKLINYWDSTCSENHHHDRGQPKKEIAHLPTRLIEILESSPDRPLRLYCPPARTPIDGLNRYTILSYCWGNTGLEGKTTPKNLSQRCTGFSKTALPRTIRDAIDITRELGIRYIWVDAVCIIQDEPSHTDFSKESMMMHEYYGNAYLTIVDASSSNNEGGCTISTLDDCLISQSSIAASLPTKSNGKQKQKNPNYEIRLHSERQRFKTTDYYHRGVEESVWASRGWTFQERCVSKRLAIFSEIGLWWQCSGYLRWQHDDFGDHSMFGPRGSCFWNGRGLLVTGTFWFRELETYSKCIFTDPTDRLIALSGVAKTYQKYLDGLPRYLHMREGQAESLTSSITYLRGMWSNNIPMSLAWVRSGHGKKLHSGYLGPSWSFLSIDGPVLWYQSPYISSSRGKPATFLKQLLDDPFASSTLPEEQIHLLLEILGCELNYVNDSFGALKPGCVLTVRGVLSQIPVKQNSSFWYPFPSRFQWEPRQDETVRWQWDFPGTRSLVFALAIISEPGPWFICLLLEPTHRTPREYRRVGIARLKHSEHSEPRDLIMGVNFRSDPVEIDII